MLVRPSYVNHEIRWVTDAIFQGNGPSALILSYILHGHIPVYDRTSPHPDPILHEKLKDTSDLLDVDVDHLTEHFYASRFNYSTQALPVNVLFDTLIRPYGETEERSTCVRWEYDPSRAVAHAVVGNTCRPGGQWVDNPVRASWDIETLSYARMLSLPGYSFDDFYKDSHGAELQFYLRPSRRLVADYLAVYPSRVGIGDSIYNEVTLSGGRRCSGGFHFGSHNIKCKHLILASGVFCNLIPPRPLLRPLSSLSSDPGRSTEHPVLVIGSGFSAADVIISTRVHERIIHIFKWDPAKAPSPLRACHQQAYPDYAGVYRRMKLAALSSSNSRDRRPRNSRRRSSAFDLSRDWTSNYEGLPNTEIIDVRMASSSATLTLRNDANEVFERQISRLAYVVGRRGSLEYVDADLREEVGVSQENASLLSGQMLRSQAHDDLEVARDMFIVGSLTGDSLIRFAYGSCAYASGRIMSGRSKTSLSPSQNINGLARPQTQISASMANGSPMMNGLDGHNSSPHTRKENYNALYTKTDAEGAALAEIRPSSREEPVV